MELSNTILISYHIPKTGGTTLTSILEKVYREKLQLAYGDERDKVVDKPLCYHGHLIFKNYADVFTKIPDAMWITFLRDPLMSAVSLYYYGVKLGAVSEMGLTTWLTTKIPGKYRWPDPPAYNHNRFSKGINDWERFDFIGITEYFDKSIQFLSKKLIWPNVKYSPVNVGNYSPPEVDESVISEFKRLNSKDYEIYNKAILHLQN